VTGGEPGPPGLQAERTRLAWRRTTLAATAVALLAGSRVAIEGGTPSRLGAVALMSVTWLAILLTAHRRITALGRWHRAAVGRSPAVLALLIALYGLMSVLLVAGEPLGR